MYVTYVCTRSKYNTRFHTNEAKIVLEMNKHSKTYPTTRKMMSNDYIFLQIHSRHHLTRHRILKYLINRNNSKDI